MENKVDLLNSDDVEVVEIELTSTDEKRNAKIARLLEIEKNVIQKAEMGIEKAAPLVLINQHPLFYCNTLNIIQGQQGSHKSRLCEHIASALISKLGIDLPLRLNRHNDLNIVVIYFDTERSYRQQLPESIQRILMHSGFEKVPENLRVTSLKEQPRRDRFETMKSYIQEIRKEFPSSHYVLIVDVITDLVTTFNNEKESFELLDLFNVFTEEDDFTVIGLIHENPNSTKARGHLGTEAVNKASTVLSIRKAPNQMDSEESLVYEIESVKMRNTAPLKKMYVKYCEEERGLIFASSTEVASLVKNQKANLVDVIPEFIKFIAGSEVMHKDVVTYLAAIFNASERTISDRVGEIKKAPQLIEEKGYKLIERKDGVKLYYSLTEIEKNTPE